ncbi:beta-arabinofuranosyltransferase RAY1 [Selaginella moellendorffii]|uniref:beta-arabinofuranosyltransferase RAY1 n=1 Tax=Selaginella moellendorffii TaxID=88036 RepID=UPI000D1C728C|nr:beta-arabinofuranosyltransferase RAY1 [Selaginella moellendorffii]|eukprot:XP_024541663.1 beta-arabinofuranosyltransferase RAY1 [Selaginella moellendorffii]
MLVSTWIVGMALVLASLYATHRIGLPHGRNLQLQSTNPALNLTIFAAPSSIEAPMQRLALHSWLDLVPPPCVVLLGSDPSLHRVVSSLDQEHCISVESNVDSTFQGVPFFHSMVARARSVSSGVVVIVDPDVVLPPSLTKVLSHVRSLQHRHWLMVATSKTLPGSSLAIDKLHQVEDYVSKNGRWSECGGVKLWAWNPSQVPLHAGVLPPFRYGAGFYNQWMLNEAIASELRVVIDVSEALGAFQILLSNDTIQAPPSSSWEVDANARLARTYGSYAFKPPHFSNQPVARLFPCGSQLCHQSCDAGGRSQALMTSFRRYVHESESSCGKLSAPQLDCSSSQHQVSGNLSSITSGYSYQLESLLLKVSSPDKVVVLTVVSHSYRDMLMSWVCRLRHLNVTNYLVATIDKEMYQFGILQGLPVFRTESGRSDSKDCTFGSSCFKTVTKSKSRTVLRILELGYSVLFSDVDVYWFSSPIRELMAFGPGVLAAQTDEYNEKEAVNLPRRLNSGFYFAWSDNATIVSFRKIVKHAAKSKLSEQPSFYDVLCGEDGKHRKGNSSCVEPETNLTVEFLDRWRYPNGAYKLIWDSKDVRGTCQRLGCVILHNNWKTGHQQKIERQTRAGLWEYDPETRMCSRAWKNHENSKHLY